jgi:hypothetical protein
MRKPKLLILALIVSVLGLFAGVFDPIAEELWSNTYDHGNGNDYARGVAVNSEQCIIVAGSVDGATNYGTNSLAMKYNPPGDTVLWSEEIDSGIIGGKGGCYECRGLP